MVAETDRRPAPDLDDRRRRYYAITAFGRRVVSAEASRASSGVVQSIVFGVQAQRRTRLAGVGLGLTALALAATLAPALAATRADRVQSIRTELGRCGIADGH